MRTLTDILLREEGVDPANEKARSIAWVSVHRPARQFVAGEVPEGSWGAGGRVNGLGDIAAFVLGDAEAGAAYARRQLAMHRAGRDAAHSR